MIDFIGVMLFLIIFVISIKGKNGWLLLLPLVSGFWYPWSAFLLIAAFFIWQKEKYWLPALFFAGCLLSFFLPADWLLLTCFCLYGLAVFWGQLDRKTMVLLLIMDGLLAVAAMFFPDSILFLGCLVGLIQLFALKMIRYLFQETDMVYARSLDQIMANYVQEVNGLYENMRGWRHDYHNHLQSLKTTVKKQQYAETLAYLNDLELHLQEVEQIVKSGNPILDAVLNSKLSLAQQQAIPLNVKAFVGTQPLINDIDLVVILGNILDNAIEANLEIVESEERLLRVYISILKQQLYIIVTNARSESQVIQPAYASTKNDKRGLGIRRINALVEKYDGMINRQYEDGVFVTEILLPLSTITK